MRASVVSVVAALLSDAALALPSQSPMMAKKPVIKAMLSDLKESSLVPTGCFCAAGALCCQVGDDAKDINASAVCEGPPSEGRKR